MLCRLLLVSFSVKVHTHSHTEHRHGRRGSIRFLALILKHFCASPLLFRKSLFHSTLVFWCVFMVLEADCHISTLWNLVTVLKTPLLICVVLDNSRGKRTKRFRIRPLECTGSVTPCIIPHLHLGVDGASGGVNAAGEVEEWGAS